MNILLKRGNLNGNRSVPCKFMSDSEYSVIKNEVLKRFDCILKLTFFEPDIIKLLSG